MNSNTELSADLLRMQHKGVHRFVAIAKHWELDVPTRCRVLGALDSARHSRPAKILEQQEGLQ